MSVVPLRFGMRHQQTVAASCDALLPGTGTLACVAVNALQSPQIWLDTLRLVRQVRPELTHRLFGYVTGQGHGHDARLRSEQRVERPLTI
ncbi:MULTISPECIES: hypothetical protein [unclassified Kitasatospora]|uniref:hypothetical protein n=1 Tax=unclassified Kitasatospora TaxID=2633591 RepID=UPI0034105853